MFITYAQNFEDVMLWRALKTVERGFYVDIGANEPVVDSVSRAFYDRGWRGVHVEPVAHFAQKLRADRPDEPVIEKAVGSKAGRMTLHVIPDTGLSSLVPEVARTAVDLRGYAVQEIEVEIVTLADLLAPYDGRDIHWLKIDIEGAEGEVLRGWDPRRHRPWIMLVEATAPNSQVETHREWEDILLGADYVHAWFDGLSRFYVARERAHLLDSFRTPPNVFDDFVSRQLLERHDRMAIAEQRVAQLEAALAQAGEAAPPAPAAGGGEADALIGELEKWIARVEAARAADRLARQRAEVAALTAAQQAEMLRASSSWRITAPLRKATTALRTARGRPDQLWPLIAHNLGLRGGATARRDDEPQAPGAPTPSLATSSLATSDAPTPGSGESAPKEADAQEAVRPAVADLPPLTARAKARLEEFAAGAANTRLEEVSTLAQTREAGESFCFVIDADGPQQGPQDRPQDGLERSLQSVLRQTDPSWEVLLVVRPGCERDVRRWLDVDWRIRRVEAPDADLTTIAEAAAASFLVALRCGDTLDDDYVRLSLRALRRQDASVDLIYCDEARISESGDRIAPFYKPDWSPEHLQSVNYVGRGYAIRKSLVLRLPAPVAATRDGRDYELALAATAQGRGVAHADDCLYLGAGHVGAQGGFFAPESLEEARRALETHLRGQDEGYRVVADAATGALDVRGPRPAPTVTLAILTGLSRRDLPGRGETLLVDHFVRSIVERTQAGPWTILVVDDGELPDDTLDFLERHGHRRVSFPRQGAFSFAKKANFALRQATTEVVILLNDDLEVISPDWVERLAEIAARPQVGVVGAQLYYDDGTIQHAGLVLGFHGAVGQIFHAADARDGDYAGFLSITRNYSSVTGAVMAMRKDVFEQVNGFDERFAIDYNDVDFCLRCLENGLRIVQTAHVKLYHFHNSSLQRKHDAQTERDLFRKLWAKQIEADPFYNRHLQLEHNNLPPLIDDAPRGVAAGDQAQACDWRAGYDALRADLARAAEKALAAFDPGWRDKLALRSGGLVEQARAILARGLFDADFYLRSYPDVAGAGADPLAHYLRSGDAEGRAPNPVFDPRFYRAQFEGAGIGAQNALHHYAVYGEAAGLSASSLFNGARYKNCNPDLADWLDWPLTHYLHVGRKAGLSANSKTRLPGDAQVQIRRVRDVPGPVDVSGLRRAVNVIGPLDRVAGLGVSARGYLDAAEKSGIGPVGARAQTREFAIQTSLAGVRRFPDPIPDAAINLCHMNGDTLPMFLESGGEAALRNRYNIAIWYWELATLRPEWVASMKHFHEFWAPTPFIARAIQRSTDKPVRLVAPYLAHLATAPQARRSAGPARYLYCFDANSILERKNPGALLDAFARAFPRDGGREARLTFKITYPNRAVADVERLYAAAAADPRIEIVDGILAEEELQRLICESTAYVSPHRSEGLGLTVIEAMAAGVPVIATPYGGVDMFVTPDAAWPIRSRLVELADEYMPYPKGFVWADPEVEALAEALVAVADAPDEAAKRAETARRRVLDVFASQAALDVHRRELARVAASLFPGAPSA